MKQKEKQRVRYKQRQREEKSNIVSNIGIKRKHCKKEHHTLAMTKPMTDIERKTVYE